MKATQYKNWISNVTTQRDEEGNLMWINFTAYMDNTEENAYDFVEEDEIEWMNENCEDIDWYETAV